MRKGSKRTENAYTLEISDLAFKSSFTASSNSLRELIKMTKTHVPAMDTYSKVYREMRVNVGVYMALFTMRLPDKKIRRVVVHITSLNITDEDIERFHAHCATLPQRPEGFPQDLLE
jgi:predicted small metal-binding protein